MKVKTMQRHPLIALKIATVLLVAPALSTASRAQPITDPFALIEAAKRTDHATVHELIEAGTDVNTRYGDGTTALHWAAHRDALDLVVALLAAGANAGASDDHGVTSLALACLNGNLSIVDTLLAAGADANAARANGESPLMTAARVGSLAVVRRLLAAGADPNTTEATLGQTALMFAVANHHTAVARTLLEIGASASTQSKDGFTPLLFAAQQGNIEAAALLLSAGADANEAAPDGIGGNTNARSRFVPNTEAAALLVAIDSGHADMARFLLEQGADPNHAGAGRTALHSAVQRRMPKVVASLLERGATPNVKLEKRLPLVSRRIGQSNGLTPSNIGATPFFLAASFGDLELMRLLIQGGADPTLRVDDGTTALMVAAGADYVEGADKYGLRWFGDNLALQESALEAVKYLLNLGLDVNATNQYKQTTLHAAVYLGGTFLVPYLVEQGANINAINQRGQTPWMIAAEGEYRSGSFYTHKETGDILEKLGADTTLGEDLGQDFRKILAARSESQN
ncbi:MAG: ankyrin repeat domain-containing protein [Acidobacteriota bacterium]|nr:ankyrin repeat domain-containing protein [Acidobacteriota bacterium]